MPNLKYGIAPLTIDATSTYAEVDVAHNRVNATFDSLTMDEQMMDAFIKFGEQLGEAKEHATLTMHVNLVDITHYIIDNDLNNATGKVVGDEARNQLLSLKAQMIEAIDKINAAL